MSQPQIFSILEIFKDFFACKIVLAANHHNPGKTLRSFRRQKFPSSTQHSFNKQYPSSNQQQQPEIIQQPAATTGNHPASSIPAITSNHLASSIPAATSNHPASSIPAATSNHPQPVSTQQLFGNNQQSSSSN